MPIEKFSDHEQAAFLDAVGEYQALGVRFDADHLRDGMVRVTRYPDGVSRVYKQTRWYWDLAEDLRAGKDPWGRP